MQNRLKAGVPRGKVQVWHLASFPSTLWTGSPGITGSVTFWLFGSGTYRRHRGSRLVGRQNGHPAACLGAFRRSVRHANLCHHRPPPPAAEPTTTAP